MKRTVTVCDRCQAVIERPAVTVEIQANNQFGKKPKPTQADLCPECKTALEGFLSGV